jgi:hypothetical protein
MQACSIEPGGPCKISERWRLIGGTRLPTLDQMAAGAPACRDFLAVISIRRGGRVTIAIVQLPANNNRNAFNMICSHKRS